MAEASAGPRRVVVAGASGLIGRALVASLRADGVAVTRLVRRPAQSPDEVAWLTDSRPLDPGVLAGAEAVVGLNGASIARMPWTARYRSTLLWSRITPTRTLATALRTLGDDAPAFVSASAVGFYGSAPGRALDEHAPSGDTFLADVCGEWEKTAASAGRARVALLRTAPVVHREGVLKPLMLLTRLGVAGPLGRGVQVMPWISLSDEVRAIRHVIDGDIDGPVNLAGPTRATANDLGFALAMRMNRPYLLRTPSWALRAVLGRDAADALLLADAHVVPAVLASSGFRFRHPTVEDAVADAVPDQDAERSAASSRSD
nr:TIGR01777 family oxidoreductase [Microbacterium bovistercoris]